MHQLEDCYTVKSSCFVGFYLNSLACYVLYISFSLTLYTFNIFFPFNDSELNSMSTQISTTYCLHSRYQIKFLCPFKFLKVDICVLQQEYHVTEKKEHPVAMNAFELISMSKGLNLGNLFEIEQVIAF